MEGKEQILETIAKLFFRYGVKSLSMDDIAWKSGLTKRKLYDYFKNKEEIVTEVVLASYNQWRMLVDEKMQAEGNPIEILLDIYYSRFQLFTDFNPLFFTETEKTYREIADLYKRFGEEFNGQVIVPLLQNAEQEGHLKKGVDIGIVCDLHNVLFDSLLHTDRPFLLQGKKRQTWFKHWIEYPVRGILNEDI